LNRQGAKNAKEEEAFLFLGVLGALAVILSP
jgi:hypothetical protein